MLAASCSSVVPMSDDEIAECTNAASSEGTIGGSATLTSSLVLRLPDEAVLDAAFGEEYGISVDEFLGLREDADAAATVEFGEPPSVGEQVSDERFVRRDVLLMLLWNERYPASARTLCEVVIDDAGETS